MLYKLSPTQKHSKQIWPCHENGQGQPRVIIIYENIWSTRVPDAVYQVSRTSASWFRRRRFLKLFTIYGQWSCDLEHLNKFSFPTSHGGSIWNLASIGLAVSEQKKSEVNEWPWPLIFIQVHVLIQLTESTNFDITDYNNFWKIHYFTFFP